MGLTKINDKKPRELTHESIQWVPKKYYDALAKENASLRESLAEYENLPSGMRSAKLHVENESLRELMKEAVDVLEELVDIISDREARKEIDSITAQPAKTILAKIKAKHGEL